MAIHLSQGVIDQLRASCDRTTLFSKVPVKVKGIDMDAMHRKFRIMKKNGLMRSEDIGQLLEYRITSKGRQFLLDL